MSILLYHITQLLLILPSYLKFTPIVHDLAYMLPLSRKTWFKQGEIFTLVDYFYTYYKQSKNEVGRH